MIVILAIDALEYTLVDKFKCRNLQQEYYGRTDISEFSEPRTVVLWSSFLTGKNREHDVLSDGNKEMWNKKWSSDETFFSGFNNVKVIDLPGYSYDLKEHEKSRKLLKQFFLTKDQAEKESIKKQYNSDALSHHKKIKQLFLNALDEDHDLVLGYFSFIDVIGHLNFGDDFLMRMLYKEADEIAQKIRRKGLKLIVISDHGMKAIGKFGDHSEYGFWSANFETGFDKPKITDFYNLFLNKEI